MLLRGQYDGSGAACGGPGVVDPSPSSLNGKIVCNGSGEAGAGMRRSDTDTEAVRRRDEICSSNLGVLRKVCVLPDELEGLDGRREDDCCCWRCGNGCVNGS